MKLTPEEERIEDKLDILEDKLKAIWDDEGFIIGVESDLDYNETKIDKMLMFLNDNPGIDTDEIILESLSIDSGEDERNYDNPYYHTKRFIRNYEL